MDVNIYTCDLDEEEHGRYSRLWPETPLSIRRLMQDHDWEVVIRRARPNENVYGSACAWEKRLTYLIHEPDNEHGLRTDPQEYRLTHYHEIGHMLSSVLTDNAFELGNAAPFHQAIAADRELLYEDFILQHWYSLTGRRICQPPRDLDRFYRGHFKRRGNEETFCELFAEAMCGYQPLGRQMPRTRALMQLFTDNLEEIIDYRQAALSLRPGQVGINICAALSRIGNGEADHFALPAPWQDAEAVQPFRPAFLSQPGTLAAR